MIVKSVVYAKTNIRTYSIRSERGDKIKIDGDYIFISNNILHTAFTKSLTDILRENDSIDKLDVKHDSGEYTVVEQEDQLPQAMINFEKKRKDEDQPPKHIINEQPSNPRQLEISNETKQKRRGRPPKTEQDQPTEKKRRGRPPKAKAVGETEEVKPKRRRGRPPKNRTL